MGMLAMVGFGLAVATSAPDSGAGDRGAPASEPASRSNSPTPSTTTLGRSKAVWLKVPAMKVDGRLSHIGLRKNNKTLQLPPNPKRAAWYKRSASPGEIGPTVLLGFIDAGERGPGVFRRMQRLRQGHAIYMMRKDGVLAAYRVDAVKSYRPGKLPVRKVYGATDHSALRIVTTGGSLTKAQGP
ncbi:MAG: sortase, partial [Actinophytocola sp.]|nr:sortase [Actinophytocola sp.]